MEIIVILIAVGLICLLGELFVPGTFLLFVGGGFLLLATIVTMLLFGWEAGLGVFSGSVVAAGVTFALELWLVGHKKSPFILRSTIARASVPPAPAPHLLVGQRGEVVTPLNPGGRIRIGSEVFEAVSIDGLLSPPAAVEVVGAEAYRLRVKRLAPA